MADHPLQWEEIACPLCDAEAEEEVLTVPGEVDRPFRLVRCRDCGMTYLNPRPDESSIGRFYPEDYEPYQPPQDDKVPRWQRDKVKGQLAGQLVTLSPRHLVRRFLGGNRDSMTSLPFEGGGRLLDYGCGSGWYAHRMRERGWQVTGMDMSPHAVGKARQHFGLEVIHGALPHPAVDPESFDVVTMGAVLEHVHWPHRVIAAAARALKPGGRLVISVPNIASWGYRAFGQEWWPLELPRHLLHFTPATLRLLVDAHGLEVSELRMLGRTGWMRRSLSIARKTLSECASENAGKVARSHSRTLSLSHSLLVSLGQLRMIQSWLTRWTVWTGQADCLLLIARRAGRVSELLNQAA